MLEFSQKGRPDPPPSRATSDLPEHGCEPGSLRQTVEISLDDGPGASSGLQPRRRVREMNQGGGQRLVVAFVDEDAVLLFPHRLRNAAVSAADDGKPGRHRLGDDERHPFHVAVRRRDARGDEEIRFPHSTPDFTVREPPDELDAILDAEIAGKGLKTRSEFPVAHEANAEPIPRSGECDRADEMLESLLLDESTDGERDRRPLPAIAINRLEVVEPDAESMQPNLLRGCARGHEALAEIAGVRKQHLRPGEEFVVHVRPVLLEFPRDVVAVVRDAQRSLHDARLEGGQHDPTHRTELTVDRVVAPRPPERRGDLQQLPGHRPPAEPRRDRAGGDTGCG